MLRDTLAAVLAARGHQVRQAADGQECLDLLAAEAADLLLLDVVMPRLDGIAVMRRLAALCPDLKVVAMSGGGEDFQTAPALKLTEMFGARRTLFKPFTNKELVAAVDEVLASA